MKASWLVKINLLLLALLFVVFAMFKLEDGAVERGIALFLGVPQKPAATAQVSQKKGRVARVMTGTQLSWCEGPVKSLKPADGHKIDSAALKKWLGRHCSLNITEESEAAEGLRFSPALVVDFEGSKGVIEVSESGLYRWKGQIFRSLELEAALSSLKSLPSRQDVK